MEIYLILLIIALLSTIIKKDNYFFCIVLVILLILVVGFRCETVGTDTYDYVMGYKLGYSERIEPMFLMISNLCKELGLSSNVFFTIIAALTIGPLWWFIKRESKNPGFSLLIYLTFSIFFYFQTFNIIRCTLAITYVFLGTYYLSRKKMIQSVVLFLIGFLFHYSSIIIILTALLLHKSFKFSFVFVLLTTLSSFLIGFFFNYFLKDYMQIIGEQLSLFDNSSLSNYSILINKGEGATMQTIGMLTNTVPYTLFAIVAYNKSNSNSLYYKLYIIGVIISNILISTSLFYRISIFFQLYLILIFPNAYEDGDNNHKKISGFLTIFMVVWFIYKLINANETSFCGAFPYKSCF